MHTKESIFNQLKQMGVPQNCPVTVHTSLKAIGEVCGRGEGFLQILIDYVTEKGGLLIVPTHTWQRAEDDIHPSLDVNSNEVCIGTLPKIAATYKGGLRSLHPTHSVAVFGNREKAQKLVLGDTLAKTQSDPKGSLGEAERNGGYILLIGVGNESNTYIHTAEEELGVKGRFTDYYYPATVLQENGSLKTQPLKLLHAKGIGDVSHYYPKFEPAFEEANIVTYGKIGNAKAQLLKAGDIKAVLKKVYERANGKEILADNTPLDKKLYK